MFDEIIKEVQFNKEWNNFLYNKNLNELLEIKANLIKIGNKIGG